jgi:hypothetical protein
MKVGNSKEITISELLGAIQDISTQQLTLYIPNKDKNGKQIRKLNVWIIEAQNVLTSIGRGVTTMPPADGAWENPENKNIIREKTFLMYTYIDPDLFVKNIKLLREYLHRFGRETDQGEVAFELEGRFFSYLKI